MEVTVFKKFKRKYRCHLNTKNKPINKTEKENKLNVELNKRVADKG